MATVDEIKTLLEQHMRMTDTRHSEQVDRQGRLEGRVEGALAVHSQRVDKAEATAIDARGIAQHTAALQAAAASAQTAAETRLERRVAAVETETRAQTGMIGETHTKVVAINASISTLVKVLAAAPFVVAFLWWLFTRLYPGAASLPAPPGH